MRQIPIYKAEREAGLADKILTANSIAYLTKIEIDKTPNKNKILTCAAIKNHNWNDNQIDLHYLKDILVSTGMNGNDEIFLKEEIWAAKSTPEDKPFNLGHNCKDIIGHITSQYLIDNNGNLLDENLSIDELPDYHVVSTSVIYKYWADKERMEQINRIIAEIETEKKWFVSMEALFANYDYGVFNEKGEMGIIPRNETTAFLTKHLRAYGGEGKYENYRLGRVIRNITFSGKGLVECPANPNSIIFNDVTPFKIQASEKIEGVVASLGYSNSEETKDKENSMSVELENLKKTNTELENSLKEVQAAKATLEKQIVQLEAKLTEGAEKEKALNVKLVDVETQLKASKDEFKASTDKLKTVETELNTIKAEKTKNERISALKGIGVEEAKVTELYEILSELSDAKFNDYVTKAKVAPKVEEKPKVDVKVLENVEAGKDVGSGKVDAEGSTLQATQAKIAEFYKASKNKETAKN